MPRVAPTIALNSMTESALQHLVRSPSTPQGLASRARIVLRAAAQQSNQEIAGALERPKSRLESGGAPLRKWVWTDCRTPRGPVAPANTIVKPGNGFQTRVCQQPEFQSRWSVRTLAKDLHLPSTTVHEILAASRLSRIASGRSRSAPTPTSKLSCWIL